MKIFVVRLVGFAICAALSLFACVYVQQAAGADQDSGPKVTAQQESAGDPSSAAPAAADDSLLAQGRALYVSATYRCSVCHGDKGEGADGPDLVGSLLTEDQIANFLQKPSAVATSRGMPPIPAKSPDLKPLAAYVFSMQAP